MLRTRALVAAIALPILIPVIVIGGWPFALVVAGALLLAGDEYVRLLRQGDFSPPEWLTLVLIALALGAVWFDHPDWREPGLTLLLIGGVFNAIVGMERGSSAPVINLALAVLGGVYIGWLGSRLLAVRMLDEGAYLTLMLYGCVIISDSAAYFVGRAWGRHTLAPAVTTRPRWERYGGRFVSSAVTRVGALLGRRWERHTMSPLVSPKKSWEGYVGGVIAAIVFGTLAGGLPDTNVLTAPHGAIIGLLIGVLGTVGDLGISAIKRQVGAKDSGQLIPGHGGILDRTDSVLVAAAVGYYYLTWFVI